MIIGVGPTARDEDDTSALQVGQPGVIDVAHVEHQHRAGGKRLGPRDRHVVPLAFGDHQDRRQVAVVIEREMQLHRAFPAAECRPRKDLRAQINHRRIQAQQLVLEPKLLRARHTAAAREELIEHGLVQLPGPVRVGIGQRRPTRRLDPQMCEPALATRQAATDLAQGMGAAQLAEQHRHKLAPAREAPRVPLRLCGHHRLLKIDVRKELD